MPRIAEPIQLKRPVEVDELKFLKAHTTRKITVPRLFTMSEQSHNDFYKTGAEAAMAYAAARARYGRAQPCP